MKKKCLIAGASIAMFVLAAACVSHPAKTTPTPAPIQQAPTKMFYDIIDHKGMALGKAVPDWILDEAADLEKSGAYKGNYLFKFEESGKNLDAVKSWAQNFSAPSEIAKIVTTRVQQKFAGAQAGDKDKLGIYFENVVKVLSQADYTGAKKIEDWWILKQYNKDAGTKAGQQEYTYYMLYGIPKDTLDQLIQDQLEKVKNDFKPTNEEATAMDRVKQAFVEGF
jgi:hypothetical protein